MNVLAKSGPRGVRRIERSRTKLAGLLLGSIAFCALGWWLANAPEGTFRREGAPIVGWVGVVFFGLCGVTATHRLLFGDKWPVTLSEAGLIDLRMSKTLVPWSLIRSLRTLSIKGTRLLILDIDQGLKLQRSMLGGVLASISAATFGTQYSLTTTDLKVSFSELHNLVHDYWRAYGPPDILNGLAPSTETKGA